MLNLRTLLATSLAASIAIGASACGKDSSKTEDSTLQQVDVSKNTDAIYNKVNNAKQAVQDATARENERLENALKD